jgi:hypothetical protein
MQNFFDWFRANINEHEPWLILGKGPSFDQRHTYDLSRFRTLSLNHAVREQSVRLAHMIDYTVVVQCAEAIMQNAEALVMPWRPHVNFVPARKDLRELAQLNPTLRLLNEQGRLLWYNLSTAPEAHGDSPIVRADYFSAEAGLNLLAQAGVRQIRSLGVDGGRAYSSQFDDLKNSTLLANGHASFDPQFKGFARTILATGVDYAPLDTETPIRIYVGATEAQRLAVKVLEYSIRKHASMSVEVFPLHRAAQEIPQPVDAANRPRTPFSFQRFLIPALAGYQGRAIYLDSDMLVFRDIRQLWTMPFDGADLLAARAPGLTRRRPQFSVMLLDCEALKWDVRAMTKALDEGELSYEQLMFEMAVAKNIRAAIDPAWNSLEHFRAGKTALLHYTDMERQPWLSRLNPLNRFWTQALFEALDGGHIRFSDVEDDVQAGYVRPSLLHQIDQRISDSRHLKKEARALDSSFVAPGASTHRQATTLRQRVKKFVKTIPIYR